MKIDHELKTITFRQSWIDTAQTCGERGRLAIVKPEWDTLDSDAALIGTAMHAGIERFLRGEIDNVGEYAYAWAMTNISEEQVRWAHHKTIYEIAELAQKCGDAWMERILPHVPLGGSTEVHFNHALFEYRGYEIRISGTIDYVLGHEMWDWKSSGWEYKAWEKQRWAIQPTVYSTAAVLGALEGFEAFEYPTTFRYGVVYKPRKKGGPCDADIVTVTRLQSDQDWLYRKLRTFTDLAMATNLDVSWPMIDVENHLCSSKWCPWWSICKGAHVSEDAYVTPDQRLPKVMPAVPQA